MATTYTPTNLTLADIGARLDAATPCPDIETCKGDCDDAILHSAYDALATLPAGVVVTAHKVEPLFDAPFTRLTATWDTEGETRAVCIDRAWDLAEGLWDIVAAVRA